MVSMDIEPWQVLASLGVVLALFEFFTPTFFALPAGLAFLATAVFALFTRNWSLLALLLALNLALVYALFHRFVWPRVSTRPTKTNAEAMVGKIAVVTEAIDPDSGSGEVKLYGDLWKVISEVPFSVGSRVLIVRTEGNRVVVTRPAP